MVGVDAVDGTGSVGVETERGAGSVGHVDVTSANAKATASDASPASTRASTSVPGFVIDVVIDSTEIQDPGHPKRHAGDARRRRINVIFAIRRPPSASATASYA
jgi:hypothetical protein